MFKLKTALFPALVLYLLFHTLLPADPAGPLFNLDFSKGITGEVLTTDGWTEVEGIWSGEKPPTYYPFGITGNALIVGDTDGTQECPELNFRSVMEQSESGTVLFWVRGLEDWFLWGSEREESRGTNVLRGIGMTINRNHRHQMHNIRAYWYKDSNINLLLYPRSFDKYRWTQLGYTWQSGYARLFHNGSMAAVSPNFPEAGAGGGMTIAGGHANEGCLRLYDNIRVWDRALSESEIKRIYRHDFRPANMPLVTAGRLHTPPEIDGVIDEGQWRGASAITGLLDASTGEAVTERSVFYIGYDDEYLFIAMKGDFTEEAMTDPEMVMHRFLKSDNDISADDIVDIIISPGYWDYPLEELGHWKTGYRIMHRDFDPSAFFTEQRLGGWHEYRLASNAAGAFYDTVYGEAGKNTAWNPGWESVSSVSADGWHFEARIPLDAMEITPEAGKKWGFNLARNWRHLQERDDVWAWGQRQYNGIERYTHIAETSGDTAGSMGILRFGKEAEPVVRVLDTGDLGNNRIRWHATIQNPSVSDADIKVNLFTDTDEVAHHETIHIPTGASADFIYNHDIQDYAVSNITFEVLTVEGELLHRTSIPFYLEQAFEMRIEQWPNYHKFIMELDLGLLSHLPADKLEVDLRLVDNAGNTALSDTGRGISSYVTRLEYSTEGVEAGNYTLEVDIRMGDEIKGVESMEIALTPQAEWWINRYGLEDLDRDRVPYPWTNMEVKDESVHVWGRSYDMSGGSLLPRQVTTLNYPVLSSPMRIIVETDGEVVDTSKENAEIDWTLQNLTAVEGTGSIAAGGFTLRNNFRAEYDGLFWNTLTIEPRQRVEITGMRLEIPLTQEFTDVINIMNYGLRGTGKLKEEGYVSSSTRPVWLGNGDGGIQWFCETDGWFFQQNPANSLKVEVENGQATLIITMIDMPTGFEEPHEIQFGFMATPARPKVWGTPEHIIYRGVSGSMFNHPDYPLTQFTAAIENARQGLYVSPNRSGFTEELDLYGYEWRTSPHSDRAVTTASESYRYYMAWRHWRRQFEKVCGALAPQCRGFRHLYYDVTGPGSGTNPDIGQGYQRRDGTVAPTGHLLDHREVTRRLYNIALSNPESHPRDSWIGYHTSTPRMIYMSFASAKWTAENLNGVICAAQPTYLGLVDVDVYRAEYMGHNFGHPSFFLGQGRIRRDWVEENGGPEAVFDHISGLDLLHDGAGVCCIMPSGILRQVRSRMRDAIDKHNLRHWKYRFIPYWNQEIIQLPAEGIHASIYMAQPSILLEAMEAYDRDTRAQYLRNRTRHARISAYFDPHLPESVKSYNTTRVAELRCAIEKMQDKAVIIVYNDTDWEGELRLEVDWKKLGLGAPETLSVENAVHSTGFRVERRTDDEGNEYEEAVFFHRPEEYARIEDGLLVFPMTRYNYRMIAIE